MNYGMSSSQSSTPNSSQSSSEIMTPPINERQITLPNGKKVPLDEYRRTFQQNQLQKRIPVSVPVNPQVAMASPQKKIMQRAIPTNKINNVITNTSPSDETRNSARMLVILESGEQRLITFTLPKETCTVQELLEQVGVQFNSDTNLQCVSNPGASIDYVVTVGSNHDTNPSEIATAVENSIQNGMQKQQQQQQLQNTYSNQLNPPPLVASTVPTPQQVPTPVANAVSPPLAAQPGPKPKSPEPPKEPQPKYIDGYLAVCSVCGYTGYNHAKCQRCHRIFTQEPKKVQFSSALQGPLPTAGNPQMKTIPGDKEKKSVDSTAKTVKHHSDALALSKSTNRGRGSSSASNRGRGRGRSKAVDIEPVILTLSSDDEGDSQPPTALSQRVPDVPTSTANVPLACEPVIPSDESPPG